MDTLWLVLRIVDIACLGAVVSGVLMHWSLLKSLRWPWFRWGMLLTFAAGMYGNAGRIWMNAPGGPWIVCLTIGYLILAVGCYLPAVRHTLSRLSRRRQ